MARAFADLGHDLRILSPALEREANLDFDFAAETPVDLEAHAASLAALRRADRALGTLATGHPSRVGQEVRNLIYNQLLSTAAERYRGWEPDVVYERYALFGFGGLELARCLALRPEIIFCDEVFSGLSASEVASMLPLIEKLKMGGITLVLIEHRLRELFKVADRVMALQFGEKIAEGHYKDVIEDARVKEAYLGIEEV